MINENRVIELSNEELEQVSAGTAEGCVKFLLATGGAFVSAGFANPFGVIVGLAGMANWSGECSRGGWFS